MRTLAAFFVLLLVTACQTAPPEMTEAEIAQVEANVLEAIEATFEAWRQLDVEGIMEGWHPTATSWASGARLRDFGWLTESNRGIAENYTKWEGGWLETSVTVLNPDAALFQGTFDCRITRND